MNVCNVQLLFTRGQSRLVFFKTAVRGASASTRTAGSPEPMQKQAAWGVWLCKPQRSPRKPQDSLRERFLGPAKDLISWGAREEDNSGSHVHILAHVRATHLHANTHTQHKHIWGGQLKETIRLKAVFCPVLSKLALYTRTSKSVMWCSEFQ